MKKDAPDLTTMATKTSLFFSVSIIITLFVFFQKLDNAIQPSNFMDIINWGFLTLGFFLQLFMVRIIFFTFITQSEELKSMQKEMKNQANALQEQTKLKALLTLFGSQKKQSIMCIAALRDMKIKYNKIKDQLDDEQEFSHAIDPDTILSLAYVRKYEENIFDFEDHIRKLDSQLNLLQKEICEISGHENITFAFPEDSPFNPYLNRHDID